MRLLAWLVLPFAMLVRAYRRYRSSPIVMFSNGSLHRVEWRGHTYVSSGGHWYREQTSEKIETSSLDKRLDAAIEAYALAARVDAAIIGPPKIEAPKEALTAPQVAGLRAMAEAAPAPTPKTLPNEAFKDSHGNDCLRWAGRIYVKVSGQWLYGESLKSADDSGLWLDINRKWEQLKAEQKLQEQIRKQGLRPMS